MNPQYKKGVLELCMLSLLRQQDRYGYEISNFCPNTSTLRTARCIRYYAS